MKKLLCFLLAITLITSVAMIGVNAEENERFTTYTSKLNKLYYIDTTTQYMYEYLSTGTNSDGTTFLLLYWAGGANTELYHQIIGDYLLTNPCTIADRKGPFFIIKENEVYCITDAFEQNLIEEESFYNAMVDGGTEYYLKLIGDTDDDGILNIKDATFIQTKLAEGDTYYNKYSLKLNYIADFNGDGNVNVSDATAIQKTIAGLN